MIVSKCPRCNDSFRFPSGDVPEDARAECPWCRESFPVSEVLAKLPPAVSLTSAAGMPLDIASLDTPGLGTAAMDVSLSSDGSDSGFFDPAAVAAEADEASFESDDDLAAAAGFLGPNQAHDGTPSSFGSSAEESAGPANSFSVSGPEPVAAGGLQPMKISDAPVVSSRPRRKKGSPVKSFIGIVLGGLLALPIAGGILLAIGKAPDLGFWPFDGTYDPGMARSAGKPLSQSDSYQPGGSPPEGRSIGADLIDSPADSGDAVDPADAALDQLSLGGGDTGMSLPVGTPDEAELVATPTESEGDSGIGAVASTSALPELPMTDQSDGFSLPDQTASNGKLASEDTGVKVDGLLKTREGSGDTAPTAVGTAPTETTAEMTAPEMVSPDPESATAETDDLAVNESELAATAPTESVQQATAIVDASVDSEALRQSSATAMAAADALANVAADDLNYKGLVRNLYIDAAKSAVLVDSPRSKSAADLLKKIDDLGISKLLDRVSIQWLGLAADRRPTNGILVFGVLNRDGTVLETLSGTSIDVATELLDAPPAGRILSLGRIIDSGDGKTVVITAASAAK